MNSVWSDPPYSLSLSGEEVHVWRASLNLPGPCIQRMLQTLAPEERERADRFRFAEHRERYIAGRGLLRNILSRYLNEEPDDIEFCYNRQGKPALKALHGAPDFRFNLSHSSTLALYAVARNREVGVDVESVRSDLPHEEIAEHFFSAREIAALRNLPVHLRDEGFFNCWTRKEAYLKARGDGLALSLERFTVSLAPGEPAALLDNLDDPEELSRWSLQKLTSLSGYIAALAVEGNGWRLQCWQWPDRSKSERSAR